MWKLRDHYVAGVYMYGMYATRDNGMQLAYE